MTDRANALVVTLEKDTRVDDVEKLVQAIRCLRGVASVDTNISNLQSHISYIRARTDLLNSILRVVEGDKSA